MSSQAVLFCLEYFTPLPEGFFTRVAPLLKREHYESKVKSKWYLEEWEIIRTLLARRDPLPSEILSIIAQTIEAEDKWRGVPSSFYEKLGDLMWKANNKTVEALVPPLLKAFDRFDPISSLQRDIPSSTLFVTSLIGYPSELVSKAVSDAIVSLSVVGKESFLDIHADMSDRFRGWLCLGLFGDGSWIIRESKLYVTVREQTQECSLREDQQHQLKQWIQQIWGNLRAPNTIATGVA